MAVAATPAVRFVVFLAQTVSGPDTPRAERGISLGKTWPGQTISCPHLLRADDCAASLSRASEWLTDLPVVRFRRRGDC